MHTATYQGLDPPLANNAIGSSRGGEGADAWHGPEQGQVRQIDWHGSYQGRSPARSGDC